MWMQLTQNLALLAQHEETGFTMTEMKSSQVVESATGSRENTKKRLAKLNASMF